MKKTEITKSNNAPATDNAAAISNKPIISEKDKTANIEHIDAAPMNTTETGAPVVAETPNAKTKDEITKENCKKARAAAKKAYMEKYAGNPADALRVRILDDNEKPLEDFAFSYRDADGKKCNGRGVVRASALLSTAAAKTFRDNVTEIDKRAVRYHNARNNAGATKAEQDERAAARADIAPFIVDALTAIGYAVTVKTIQKNDMDAIAATAYISNGNGNDDTNTNKTPLIVAIEGVARGRLLKYERRDNNEIRYERANAEKAAKKAAAKKNAPAAKKPAKTGKKAAKK